MSFGSFFSKIGDVKNFLLLEVIFETPGNGCVPGIQQVCDQIPGAVLTAWFDQ